VGGVELVQPAPLADGSGPIAQPVVLPNDQDTWSWNAAHELFGANE
jgi:hypothetical protein